MPAIRPGQVIVFVRFRQPKAGRLVLARVEDQEVIKFVAAKKKGVHCLIGVLDGSASYRVDGSDILAAAVGHYQLPHRADSASHDTILGTNS